ncbi:hypothetical protein C8J56DRAFT_1062291 [Mycena floridula]|nr:hypothetical protein C8J56DRAFT_1062291 [Mycena floridula]
MSEAFVAVHLSTDIAIRQLVLYSTVMFALLVLFAALASAGVILHPAPRAADAITPPASTPSVTPTLGGTSFLLDASLLTDQHPRTPDAAAETTSVATRGGITFPTWTLQTRDAVETAVA